MKDFIHIAYCFDKNYEQHAAVSIFSLLNKAKTQKIFLHLVSYKITNTFQAFLEDIKKKFDFHYKYYDFEPRKLSYLKKYYSNYISIFAYVRLFVCDLVANDTNKLIYLDSDTIVLDDISDLYYLNLDSREDRKNQMLLQLNKENITIKDVEFIVFFTFKSLCD